jgi:hypothetical protein
MFRVQTSARRARQTAGLNSELSRLATDFSFGVHRRFRGQKFSSRVKLAENLNAQAV